jgi:hypothetical protein
LAIKAKLAYEKKEQNPGEIVYAEPQTATHIRREDDGQRGCSEKDERWNQQRNTMKAAAREHAETDEHREKTKGEQRYVTREGWQSEGDYVQARSYDQKGVSPAGVP